VEVDQLKIPDELVRASEFHTHLGPYLVVGMRMGRAVTRELGDRPFTVKIRAHTGRVPPYSCLLDGVQVSTPCTVGNGCLEVADDRAMAIDATGEGRSVRISLRRDVFERIETTCTEENQESFACEIWEMPEDELLLIAAAAGQDDDASGREKRDGE
jgi:formylmethanofuran dehydrogenase subunit E